MGIGDLTTYGMDNVTMPLEVEAAQRRREEFTRERQIWVQTKSLITVPTTAAKIDLNLAGLTPPPRHTISVLLQATAFGTTGERAVFMFTYQGVVVSRTDLNCITGYTVSGQIEAPIFDQHYIFGSVVLGGAPSREIYPVCYRTA